MAATEGHWKSAAETYRKLLAMIENSSSPEELARIAVATADACERAGVLGEARENLARVVADGLAQQLDDSRVKVVRVEVWENDVSCATNFR